MTIPDPAALVAMKNNSMTSAAWKDTRCSKDFVCPAQGITDEASGMQRAAGIKPGHWSLFSLKACEAKL